MKKQEETWMKIIGELPDQWKEEAHPENFTKNQKILYWVFRGTLVAAALVLIQISIFAWNTIEPADGGGKVPANATECPSMTDAPQETENVLNVTDDIQKTVEPIKVTNNTLYFSCDTNRENTPGYLSPSEAEGEMSDCFFISENYLFIDDTVGNRILVYKDLEYDHEIQLNQDAQDMYYDVNKNIMKIIYVNKQKLDATHYGYMELSMEDGSIITNKELSNSSKILLDYYFDDGGKLNTHFKGEKTSEEKKSMYSKIKKIIPKYYDFRCCYENTDTGEYIYSVFDDKDGRERTSILCFENGEITKYAVPYEHLALQGRVKKIEGNLYELVPGEDKIQIVVLAEKSFAQNKLESFISDGEDYYW